MANKSLTDVLGFQLPAEIVSKLQADTDPPTYADKSGTPGNCTTNTQTGRAAIASGATACVVTNSLVGATSVVLVQTELIDANAAKIKCVPAAGSFTVTVNTATAAALPFSFYVVK